MSARGKVWCFALILSICLWWCVIAAVKFAVAMIMPFLILVDGR